MKGLRTFNHPYVPGILLFIVALVIGLCHYQDYGVSFDEPAYRVFGLRGYDYVFNGPHTQPFKYFIGFELPLVMVEKWLHITDSRDVYLMRHLVTHIFFLISLLFGYVLIYRLYHNRFIACLGFMMLALSPRIYAHSFFNSRDVPFLSAFIIVLALAQAAFDKKKGWIFFITGIVCGYATSIRMMGLMPAIFITLLLCADIIVQRQQRLKTAASLAAYAGGFVLCLYVAWPYLWHHALHNFADGFSSMSRYTDWGGKVFFRGRQIDGNNIPWCYFPVWFTITTPVPWLVCGLAGMAWVARDFIKRPADFICNTTRRNMLLYLLCFFAPVLAVIIFHSVIYDDWRHLYFVYPPFVIICLYFINKALAYRHGWVVGILCGVQVAATGWFMISNHPFQQVYFNSLVSHDKNYLVRHYDMEYWGASYKQALEYLLATDKRPLIKIAWSMDPVPNNFLILPERDRKRLAMVEDSADYRITNFRLEDFDKYKDADVVYSINMLNSHILYVYRVR